MRIFSRYILFALGILAASCCGGGGKAATKSAVGKDVDKVRFMPPKVPSQIGDREQQVEYLAEHFWDSYNFKDSLLVGDVEFNKQTFAAYAMVLNGVDREVSAKSITKLLDAAFVQDSTSFVLFTNLFENYFYNPNSPYLNEELYIPALQYVVDNKDIAPINKLRSKMHLEMALKNRVGGVATDFEYVLKSGRKYMMHDIDSEYIILFFNNPDCEDCARVKNYFEESEVLNSLCDIGRLKVLSVYPDKTLDLWRKTEYPQMMINSYDNMQRVQGDRLYDLKAIPTLYLLDRDKRVVAKDVSIERIEAFLSAMMVQ